MTQTTTPCYRYLAEVDWRIDWQHKSEKNWKLGYPFLHEISDYIKTMWREGLSADEITADLERLYPRFASYIRIDDNERPGKIIMAIGC